MTNLELRKQRVRDEVDTFATTGKVPETLHRRLETGDGLEFLAEEDWDALLDQTTPQSDASLVSPWCYVVDPLLPKFELAPLGEDDAVEYPSAGYDEEVDGDDVQSLWRLVVHYRSLERAARLLDRTEIADAYAEAHRTIQPIVERMAILKARIEHHLDQSFDDVAPTSDPDIPVLELADELTDATLPPAALDTTPDADELARLIRADVARYHDTGEITAALDARLLTGQGFELLSRTDYNELVEATIEDAQANGVLRDCAVGRVRDELGRYLEATGDAPAYSDDERELAELEAMLHKRVVQYRMLEKTILHRGDRELGQVHGNLRREIKSCLDGIDVVALLKRAAIAAPSE